MRGIAAQLGSSVLEQSRARGEGRGLPARSGVRCERQRLVELGLFPRRVAQQPLAGGKL